MKYEGVKYISFSPTLIIIPLLNHIQIQPHIAFMLIDNGRRSKFDW